MKNLFSQFIRYFCNITTGTLIVVALAYNLVYKTETSSIVLLQILISAIPTSLITVVIFNVKTENMNLFVRMIIHYLCICATMIVLGSLFNWIDLSTFGVLFMCLCVAFVYAFTYCIVWISNKENAKSINKALEERYKNE